LEIFQQKIGQGFTRILIRSISSPDQIGEYGRMFGSESDVGGIANKDKPREDGGICLNRSVSYLMGTHESRN
jgi:hypothetical protein